MTTMLEYIPEPDFKALASLHFLDGGHYLFRFLEDGKQASKFVRSTDVAAAFSMKEIDSGWLPAGMVRWGVNANGPWFVYATPGQTIKVTLEKYAANGESLVLTVPAPRLVLVGSGNRYRLAAMTGKHFDPCAPAMLAPFPNVYPDGRICWGSNTPPEAEPDKARRVWEMFFETPFNADLAGKKSKTRGADVRQMLLELDRKRARTYPANDLLPMNTTIHHWVESAIKERQ